MERHFFSLRIAAAVIALGLAVGWIGVEVNGFAVVHDPQGAIVGAVVVEGDRRRPMRAFATGYWAARPRGEGSIAILCANGRTVALPGSYVTRGMRTSVTVDPARCTLARRPDAAYRHRP